MLSVWLMTVVVLSVAMSSTKLSFFLDDAASQGAAEAGSGSGGRHVENCVCVFSGL